VCSAIREERNVPFIDRPRARLVAHRQLPQTPLHIKETWLPDHRLPPLSLASVNQQAIIVTREYFEVSDFGQVGFEPGQVPASSKPAVYWCF
jgi:hypothetical protein